MSSVLPADRADFRVICDIKQIRNNIRQMLKRLVRENPVPINAGTKCDGLVIYGRADIYTYVDHNSLVFSLRKWKQFSWFVFCHFVSFIVICF